MVFKKGGKDTVKEAEFKYRVKILNLLYEELHKTDDITECGEIQRLIKENTEKILRIKNITLGKD